MFCKYCGKEIDNTAKFCNYCGGKMVSNNIPEKSNVENEEDRKGIMEVFKESYNKAVKEAEEKRKEVEEKEMVEDIKKYLKPKDGKKHVIVISVKKVFSNSIKYCNSDSTLQVDLALEVIQKEGYEILDIKPDVVENAAQIAILIIYK